MKIPGWPLDVLGVLVLATGWLCLSAPTDHRPALLPPSLTPEHYELALDPDLARGAFHGVVVISGVGAADTLRMSLHCSNLLFNKTTLLDLSEGREVEVEAVEEDKLLQQCHLRLSQPLRQHRDYRLTIEYMGQIGKNGQGMYTDYYMEGERKHSVLMTHLQPNYARSVLPCWDEPHYKAQFLVKVTKRGFPTVLSNMPAAAAAAPDPGWVEFEETLPMSPYLLVVVWCDYAALSDPTTNTSVWAPRHRLHEAQLALNVSVAVTDLCERYFGREYPLPKMDHIPLPSINNGAMENWGAITYKMEYLLWEEGVSGLEDKEMTSYVVCHELVHQWLGNLVTTAWWNTTWLNEGVTTFYHFYFVDKVMPTWHGMDTLFLMQTQMIFNEDIKDPKPLTNNEPMAQHNIATSAFSATVYMKGAAIIRMVYNLMPPDVFREAIVQYVMDNQFGSVDEGDLWQSVAAVADLPLDLEVAMYSWTHQPGFPLVTVSRDSKGCVFVRQEKYLSKDEEDVRWTIPLTYTTSAAPDFNLTSTLWFPEDRDVLELGECLEPGDWIVVNIRQAGFYRVNYDQRTWGALTRQLQHGDLAAVHPANRALLLSDGFDLARHSLLDYRVVLDLARYLKRETEALPWAMATQQLMALRLHFYHTDIYPYFKRWVLTLLEGVFSSMSLTADLTDLPAAYRRLLVTQLACVLGHRRCVREATTTAYLLMSGVQVKVPPGLKPTLLCAAVRHGQDEVWHYVLKEYLATAGDERRKYLQALACTTHPANVDRLLKDIIIPTFLRNEDRIKMLSEMSEQIDLLDETLDMVIDHFHILSENFELEMLLDGFKSFMKPSITKEQKQKIAALVDLIQKRYADRDLSSLYSLMVDEMENDEYKGLKEDAVREWFIHEVNGIRRKPSTTLAPPFAKQQRVVQVHNTLHKGDVDGSLGETTTKGPPLTSVGSLTILNTNTILTSVFVVIYVNLRVM